MLKVLKGINSLRLVIYYLQKARYILCVVLFTQRNERNSVVLFYGRPTFYSTDHGLEDARVVREEKPVDAKHVSQRVRIAGRQSDIPLLEVERGMPQRLRRDPPCV